MRRRPACAARPTERAALRAVYAAGVSSPRRRLWPRDLSIRFRVSLLLLLATLNSVALAGIGVVLLSTLQEGASSAEVAAARALVVQASNVNDRVTSGVPDAQTRAAVTAGLELIGTGLNNFGADAAGAHEELELYRGAIERFYAHGHPLGAAELAGDEDVHGKAHLAELRLGYRRLVGALQSLLVTRRPEWVDSATTTLPIAMGWVVLSAVATVWFTRGLQSMLSEPLAALTASAEAVARGELDVAIGGQAGESEVTRVAEAVSAMRGRLVALIRDLDRRNHETATILANMADGVLLADRDGQVLEANAEADALLRLLASDAVRAEGSSLVGRVPEIELAHVDDGETELLLSRDAGATRRRYVEVRIKAVHDEPRQRVVMLRDVSAERELDQMKSDFMSVVTHELKTPLTAIDGYARLLARGKAGPLAPKAQGFVETILVQSGVLKDMVQNLLDTSRLEAGSLPINLEIFGVVALIEQTATTWRGSVEGKGLAFVVVAADVAGVQVRIDPFRMQQVLGNLFSNALKFTTSGSVELGARPEGDQVVIWVADSGRGIPAEAVGRIFEKFYQVERGDTRVAGGAGLGLYISRGLVEAQKGRITVVSGPGPGSRFEIRFPRMEASVDEGAT